MRLAALRTILGLARRAGRDRARPPPGDRLPVPAVVIYPGEVVRDSSLVEKEFPDAFVDAGFVAQRPDLVGKVAKRTLLPGQAIAANAVALPKLVTIGAMVRVVFEEGGLNISTYAAALQAGAAGDLISVRNPESGMYLVGRDRPGRINPRGQRMMVRRFLSLLLVACLSAPAQRRRPHQGRGPARGPARQPAHRLRPRHRPPGHRRHAAQRAVHRAVDAVDARPPRHQRAQRVAADAQRRRRARHRGPAAVHEPRLAPRRHRVLAGRCAFASGRHAGHDADVGRRRRRPRYGAGRRRRFRQRVRRPGRVLFAGRPDRRTHPQRRDDRSPEPEPAGRSRPDDART